MSDAAISMRLSNPNQLDIIDKLRDLGVGDLIALPQLVVVGDQSSGKSSVLEGISGLPFARDSGLCTRFATHIILRRTPAERVSVSIVPHSLADVSPATLDNFKRFKKENITSLSALAFTEIFDEACQVMGVASTDDRQPDQTTFSRDVLKIELSGPTHDNPSIIDIPGIFRNETPGITTKEDINLVDDLVRKYICDPRTIILCVLPANVDIATQGILSMAKEADPQGVRTIGVLTKPDLVDVEGGAHRDVIKLIEGRGGLHLALGFYLVRNRGQNDTSTDAERANNERRFFEKEPWTSIDKGRAGTEALKVVLQERLHYITRKEMPAVKKELLAKLKLAKTQLQALGDDRDSPEQQRNYLQTMAISFQKIADHALDVYYERDQVFAAIPQLKLPTLVVDRSERFSKDIASHGHTVALAADGENDDKASHKDEDNDLTEVDRKALLNDDKRAEYPELDELLPTDFTTELQISKEEPLAWIEKIYVASRGVGLMNVGPSVLPLLWTELSQNWSVLAMSYIADVIVHVHEFVHLLLQYVCPEASTRDALLQADSEYSLGRTLPYEAALAVAKFIVVCESEGTPLTHNHYFNDNLEKLRRIELEKGMRKNAVSVQVNGKYQQVVVLDAKTAIAPKDNVERSVADLHGILRAYYKVARKRFVDVFYMQAIDYHLMKGTQSPLRVFNVNFVSSLIQEYLETIAGEDAITRGLRKSLKQKIHFLEEGRKLL